MPQPSERERLREEALILGLDAVHPGEEFGLEQKRQAKAEAGVRWRIGGQVMSREQVVAKIIEEVADGRLAPAVCRQPGYPTVHTFLGWIRGNPAWRQSYKEACETAALMTVQKAMDAADASTWQTAKADVIKVDTLKWLASKLDNKTWGERQTVEHEFDMTNQTSDQLVARLVGALKAEPRLLEAMMPQLKLIPGITELLEAKRAEGVIEGEVLPG